MKTLSFTANSKNFCLKPALVNFAYTHHILQLELGKVLLFIRSARPVSYIPSLVAVVLANYQIVPVIVTLTQADRKTKRVNFNGPAVIATVSDMRWNWRGNTSVQRRVIIIVNITSSMTAAHWSISTTIVSEERWHKRRQLTIKARDRAVDRIMHTICS